MERVPAVLGEFLSNLRDVTDSYESQGSHDDECVYWCDDLRVRMIPGTPLSPPDFVKANVVIVECGVGDEVSKVNQSKTCIDLFPQQPSRLKLHSSVLRV